MRCCGYICRQVLTCVPPCHDCVCVYACVFMRVCLCVCVLEVYISLESAAMMVRALEPIYLVSKCRVVTYEISGRLSSCSHLAAIIVTLFRVEHL